MALKFTDKKFYKYLFLKLSRRKETPAHLSSSVAQGLMVGMIIPPPFQIISMIIIGTITKANRAVGSAATFITNPFTMPAIYAWNVWLGSKFIRMSEPEKFDELMSNWDTIAAWEKFFGDIFQFGLLKEWTSWSSWQAFFSNIIDFGLDWLFMFFIGGGITGIIISVPAYFVILKAITTHRERKSERIRQKILQKSKLNATLGQNT